MMNPHSVVAYRELPGHGRRPGLTGNDVLHPHAPLFAEGPAEGRTALDEHDPGHFGEHDPGPSGEHDPGPSGEHDHRPPGETGLRPHVHPHVPEGLLSSAVPPDVCVPLPKADLRPPRPPALRRNSIHITPGPRPEIISESYFYKTEAYYTALEMELAGQASTPRAADMLEAYIIPICLERCARAGVPVSCWGISYAYLTVPCLVYGVNYFADPTEYILVSDRSAIEGAVKRVTHAGKYPFCYQPLAGGEELETHVAVKGRTAGAPEQVNDICAIVYDTFRIPLLSHVFIRGGGGYRLSSLGPVRFTAMTPEQKHMVREALGVDDSG
jgi:hypothetical protein